MKYEDILKFRRSIRNYQDKPVPAEMIKTLIHESILAPNAGNEQPWKFIIITNKDLIYRISCESKKNILARIESNPNDYAKKYEKMLKNESYNIFYNATALVFIMGETNLKNLYVDCALAASYLMMSATTRGLGSCWVNFGTEIKDPKMKKEIGIPENYQIVAPIILGYPATTPPIPRRKEPEIIKVIE